MGRFLVISKAEQLEGYKQISDEYGVGFEINDFYYPDVLDDEERTSELIRQYERIGIPKGSTMHGAFLDVTVFSQDEAIRKVSQRRMEQSMQIAVRLGVKGVVFHNNSNPMLEGEEYDTQVVEFTAEYLKELLEKYRDIDIYLENMFDRTPDILRGISQKLCCYPNYGVCFDYAHASIYGKDMEQWVESLADYIRHIHINDNDLQHDMHLAVGDGMIDWKQFETYYRRYFRECSVLVETTPLENQRRSLEYMDTRMGIRRMEGEIWQ